ncbi:MAG: polysulfide reductase NrfD [Chloroflexi bacterium]|nr:polysulfide reductase NrfD [Chloroflexota bacterium]
MQKELNEFIVGTKTQQEWRWLIAIALFLAGVGSGLFIMAAWVAPSPAARLAGIIIVAVGSSLAFFLDLNRKSQFWRVMLRPRTSWISRGILLIILFTIFGILSLISSSPVFVWAATICAVGVMMYSGFVLSYSPAIPFWNTPLLPLISIVYALMGGAAALFALAPAGSGLATLEIVEMGLIVVCTILIFTYLMTMSSSTVAARESTSALVFGRLAGAFWVMVVGVGLLLPFILAALARIGLAVSGILVLVGVMELAGALTFRYCLLRAGVRLAVA